jgi:predicted Fe-S protein YdhL (DUF1289 family)
MVYDREHECAEAGMPPTAREAWLRWYASTPDAPCIAICSTAQGDAECKGCGRTFDEVQHWQAYSPAHKRAVWRRITLEARAWRFNRYAERARSARGADAAPVDGAPAAGPMSRPAPRGGSSSPAEPDLPGSFAPAASDPPAQGPR